MTTYTIEYVCSVPNDRDASFAKDDFPSFNSAMQYASAMKDSMKKDPTYYGGKQMKSYKIIETSVRVMYEANPC